MKRYALPIASVGFIHSNSVVSWLVIQTDEVSPHELLAKGYQPIDDALTDAQVLEKFGVANIVTVTNNAMRAQQN